MLIDTEIYRKIRSCRNLHWSKSQTARHLGISVDTVRKYWDGAHIPGMNEYTEENADKQDAPFKSACKEAMREYFEEHKNDEAHKQKISAQTLWRDLHYQYPRSPATFRRYWVEIQGEKPVQTRLPLLFGIGEMAQGDWKQAYIRHKDKLIKIHVWCMNLMYGYTPFKKAYLNEQQMNLADAIVSAFEYWKGVPRVVGIDNMTTCRKVGYGRQAVLTDEFKLFSAHYGCEFVFMNPGEPSEKGGIENAADTAGEILTPILTVQSMEEVNAILLRECDHYISTAKAVGVRSGSVRKMTDEERPYLLPLPVKRYETFTAVTASVNNQQLLHYDGMTFSIPRPYAEKTVGIKAYPYRFEFVYHGKQIWTCDRPLLKGENRIYAEHYLHDLKIKPRSRENALPLIDGILPPPLDEFRKRNKSKNKYTQLYLLFEKMNEVGTEKLFAAVAAVIAAGNPTAQKVFDLLQEERAAALTESCPVVSPIEEPPSDESPTIPEELQVRQHSLDNYDIMNILEREPNHD